MMILHASPQSPDSPPKYCLLAFLSDFLGGEMPRASPARPPVHGRTSACIYILCRRFCAFGLASASCKSHIPHFQTEARDGGGGGPDFVGGDRGGERKEGRGGGGIVCSTENARQKLGRGAFCTSIYFPYQLVIKEVKQIVLPRSHFHTCFPSWRSPLDLSYL